jgi:hypothetical protein
MACGFPVISSFFRSLNSTVDRITSLANGALCALSNPDAVLQGFLASIVSNINNNILQLSEYISGQIRFVINSALSPLLQVTALIRQATQTINCVKQYSSTLQAQIEAMTNNILNTSNCRAVAASIGKCLSAEINRSINKKLARSINNNLLSLDAATTTIARNIADKNIIGDFANKMYRMSRSANIKTTRF